MLNEKEYLINEIQQNCRINSSSRNGSPYKKRDKILKEQQQQRSKSEFEARRIINKKKNIFQDQDYRNQYYQNILALPFNDPRPTQEMIMILMKNPAVRQECEIIFLTQILCQYPFFSKIKQQYGLQVLQYISQLAFYKRYDDNVNIDFLENSNLILKETKDKNQINEAGEQILLVLLNGQAVMKKIKQDSIQIKAQNQQNDEISLQVGQPLQKLNTSDLMIDQGDFESKNKEYQYLTHSVCEFIAISIQDYHSIIQRTLIRQQKMKQIEIQILNKNQEVVKQYKFLKNIPIFQQFSDADIYDVMVNMTLERLTHGQILYKQGDKVEGVYLIYSGEFQVMKKQERLNQIIQCEALQVVKDVNRFIPNMDQSLIISVIKEGEIFGFEEIIQNIQHRQYTVESSAINSFVFFMKAQYFQKKFNRLINQNEYSQLVKLTEEKIMHRKQFQDKQEYLAYNMLEDIKNSSLGYQIFSKIKEDLDNSNLNQLLKKKQSKENSELVNNEKNKIYRKRLNQDSINFLEKSLSPLQKTLPFLNKNTQNFSNLKQSQITQQQNIIKQQQYQQQFIQLQTTQSNLNKEQNNLISKSNFHFRSKTPNQEINLENNSFLQSKQNTTAISQFIQTNNSTNRQKRTIDFLRESRCLTTQGNEIESMVEQPFQQNKYSRSLYQQKWNFKRKRKLQNAHPTQQNFDFLEQTNQLTSPVDINNSLQLLDTDNYDRLFVFVKSKDQERAQRKLNDQNFGIVRAVEIEHLENGQVFQKLIQTQPNESSEQFEFSNQIDDLKPIVQKRKQIYQEIKRAILQQTNQQDIGIQIHDELNAPKYLKIKQQKIKDSNSNSPKKEKRINENAFVNERSILMKFLKDKQNYEGGKIIQSTEVAPIFNHKKYSVQLGSNFEQISNSNNCEKQDTDSKKIYLSQRTSPHSQRPISRFNPQLQYFQSKKVDDNQRIIKRGDKQIKFRDNRSPPKILQIQ
ncbi:cyclic nucleotide-binding domain protein (macronuclear) [Tetrahymena thermophila SB210]|uniref:Cyclic nucleotide-binding domain protein n=1 Tax=Tetrahymena thermophila (strain SB210) TaxID=312017 RepID=Q22YS2_TETTS|nr:cyclic nucleotide-binding domain protein [Tetrahymena thermophila SB210]EAR90599.2 cyclic nucleotide-binding domain protein [Tetrahymena thermophila SB210]|eukprot:XP_001010844.2 cyclic nucleotide-binding domain protein [Tetrahymena thermophila SB210]